MNDATLIHSQIEQSMEQQQNWEVNPYGATTPNRLTEMNDDETARTLAEQIGLGIMREGGNY